MFKKIALVAAMAASASFATYNFFPVKDAGKGQVEVGAQYGWTDNSSNMEIIAGAEYSVIQNLALSLTGLGYQLWDDPDDCGEDGHPDCPDNDGFKAMTIGARYQFMPVLIAAVDVNLPLTSKDVTGDYDPFGLYGAIQFTKEFVPNLWFGSEAGLSYKFEDEKKTEGLGLTVQAELDYTLANIGLTPWIGGEMFMRISDVEEEWFDDARGGKYTHEYGSGDKMFLLWIGAGYDINPMFTVKANFIMKFADEKESLGGDWKGVNAKLAINF
ncbi:MAG: hypothetical protein SPL21_11915 [Fibrobacter sp.]|nr:hypothetical protein [Fibrobacter sp.]